MKINTEFRVCVVVDDQTLEQDSVKRSSLIFRRAGELKAAIRRHVWIEWDEQCSYCKRKLETEPSGEPVCCTKAQEEWAASQAAKAPLP